MTERDISPAPTEMPKAASNALRRARDKARRGRYEEALIDLDKALAHGADPYDCYLHKAEVYTSLGLTHEALSAAKDAVAARPKGIAARQALASLYYRSEDYDAAIAEAREVLRIEPRNLGALSVLALSYQHSGKLHSALRIAALLVRLDPANVIFRLRWALILEHLGQIGQAVEIMEQVLQTTKDARIETYLREHLEQLDLEQLGKAATLAEDDPLFRISILRDPHQAVADRGFVLSESAVQQLYAIADQMRKELGTRGSGRTYH